VVWVFLGWNWNGYEWITNMEVEFFYVFAVDHSEFPTEEGRTHHELPFIRLRFGKMSPRIFGGKKIQPVGCFL